MLTRNRKPDAVLAELIEAARHHVMTPDEREAQRQNWVRAELAMGTDADEARWKQEHGL